MKEPFQATVSGTWEPSVTTVFLPKCAKCSAPHPLARTPKLDVPNCPDCGHPVATGREETVPAVVTGGPKMAAANACFKIGRWLQKLSKGI